MFSFILYFLILGNPEPVPYGTIKFEDLYVDKREVLIIDWLEYEWYKKQEPDSSEVLRLQPDSTMTWFRTPQNRFLPMTMITYDQAIAYCQWRSKVVSEKLEKKVVYRLPTPEEWEHIAKKEFNQNTNRTLKQLDKLNKSIVEAGDEHLFEARANPVKSLVDIFGNVSEMTSVKGVAMGPNSSEIIARTDLFKPYLYEDSNMYLGFRCVAEIIEE